MHMFDAPTNVQELKVMIDRCMEYNLGSVRITKKAQDVITNIANRCPDFDEAKKMNYPSCLYGTEMFLDENIPDHKIIGYPRGELELMHEHIKNPTFDTFMFKHETARLEDKVRYTKQRVWQGKRQYQVLSNRFKKHKKDVAAFVLKTHADTQAHHRLVEALSQKADAQESRIIEMEQINIAVSKELDKALKANHDSE